MRREDVRPSRASIGALLLVFAIVAGVLTLGYALGRDSGTSDAAKIAARDTGAPLAGGAAPEQRQPPAEPNGEGAAPAVQEPDLPAGLEPPDLRVQILTDVTFDFAYVDGEPRKVVRFTTTITNTGLGPLELESRFDEELQRTVVTQNVYGPDDGPHQMRVGDFVFHPGHEHWHMDEFVSYRLYAFDGELSDEPRELSTAKTSFCITDDHRALELHAAPPEAVYGGCDNVVQGISVGWNDIYLSDLIDQWIELGPDDGGPFLPDGDYAIVADVSPRRLIAEMNFENNFSITYFSVQDDQIISE